MTLDRREWECVTCQRMACRKPYFALRHSVFPSLPFRLHHTCYSAYLYTATADSSGGLSHARYIESGEFRAESLDQGCTGLQP